MVRRAQGLLWLDQGEDVSEVAKRLGVSRQMLYVLVEGYEQRKKLPVRERIMDFEALNPVYRQVSSACGFRASK